jgi:hypothetical protein
MSRGPVVWAPADAAATESGLARYMRWLADEAGRAFASLAEGRSARRLVSRGSGGAVPANIERPF